MNELRLGLSIGRFFQQSASENNHPLCYWPPLTTYSRRSVLSFKFSVLTLLRSLHEHWAKNARSENFQLYLCAMLEYVSIKVLQSRFLVFLVWPRCSTWLTESLEKSSWFQQAENLFKFARFDDIYRSLWTHGQPTCGIVVMFSRSVADDIGSNFAGAETLCNHLANLCGQWTETRAFELTALGVKFFSRSPVAIWVDVALTEF